MKADVPNHDDSVFHDWRLADRKAHAQETALTRSSLEALDGKGQLPSEEQRIEVRKLRELANDLFARAMERMKPRANINKHD